MKQPPIRALMLACAILAACDDGPTAARALLGTTAGTAMERSTDSLPTSGPWARVVEGETGPGSRYALYLPREWNGDAVYYAHGFRDVSSPVDLRDQDGLYAVREQLGAAGYAVAYSSYSANGFVVKDGAQRTHQLRGLLASRLGASPARNFAVGASLGGGIALDLVQSYTGQYDGALLICGMVGGSQLQTQYLGDVRALADVFFPGRFAGSAIGVPAGTTVTLPQVIGAVQANPAGLFAIASTAQTPLPFVPVGNPTDPSSVAFQTMVGSLFGGVSFHARGINDVVDLVHGASPYGNTGTVYSMSATPVLPAPVIGPAVAFANATVARYTLETPAERYLERYFTPSGALAIPVLTVHNTWDPAVPVFHEDSLAARVAAAGASSLLLQRKVPAYGHCAIPVGTMVQAFNDLVVWTNTGIRPDK